MWSAQWTDLCVDLILISEVNLIGRSGIVQLELSRVSDSKVVPFVLIYKNIRGLHRVGTHTYCCADPIYIVFCPGT